MSAAPAICILTLGCPKNEVDSDRMAALVTHSAYRLVENVDAADVVVLNTCAFIQEATEESIAAALELARSRPAGDRPRIIVAGCMASRYGDELASALPEADSVLPVAAEWDLLRHLEALTGVPAKPKPGPSRTAPGPTAYLQISDGCDRRCAYCTIPSIRGRHRSTPADEILSEASFLIAEGARELVLVGQDISAWGRDVPGTHDLASLIERLCALEGDWRLRLMYLQPDGVSDRLLQVMAAHSRVCRYLDIPLQHASARVLHAMARPGDGATHLSLLARIRAALPDVSLRTTVMAGFPGESAADARELETFLAEAAFDHVGIFTFSPEEGTRAATLPGTVRADVARRRTQRLRDLTDETAFRRAAERVGSVERVLVEGEEDGELLGRTCGQAPEIDGVTFIEGRAEPGSFVDVRIVDTIGYDLVGEPLC